MRRLRTEERVDEIARMIGGGVTKAARQAAQDLIIRSQGRPEARGATSSEAGAQAPLPLLGDLLKEA